MWLAFTVIGMTAIMRATTTVNDRSVAQTEADAVALVAADRGAETARRFARDAHIDVVDINTTDGSATATVQSGDAVATARAEKPK